MKLNYIGTALAVVLIATVSQADETRLIETVRPFAGKVAGAQKELPGERRELLSDVAADIVKRLETDQEANLVFICTHNSRRSHLAQVWCQVAAEYYGIGDLKTFSGGTEATACNIRTVRALRRAGLSVAASTTGENPVYLIQYADDKPPIRAYSKKYTEEGNPSEKFAAMMCCSEADQHCPNVLGADGRFPLHYEDPKSADGTPQEAARYDERSFQIATEMFFAMSLVAERLQTK